MSCAVQSQKAKRSFEGSGGTSCGPRRSLLHPPKCFGPMLGRFVIESVHGQMPLEEIFVCQMCGHKHYNRRRFEKFSRVGSSLKLKLQITPLAKPALTVSCQKYRFQRRATIAAPTRRSPVSSSFDRQRDREIVCPLKTFTDGVYLAGEFYKKKRVQSSQNFAHVAN